jgi:hypothetical protein
MVAKYWPKESQSLQRDTQTISRALVLEFFFFFFFFSFIFW